MNDLILSQTTSFFSIFGWGFLAGCFFAYFVVMVTNWIKHKVPKRTSIMLPDLKNSHKLPESSDYA